MYILVECYIMLLYPNIGFNHPALATPVPHRFWHRETHISNRLIITYKLYLIMAHLRMVLALYQHNRKMLLIRLFTFFLSPPHPHSCLFSPSFIQVTYPLLSLSLSFLLHSNFCTCLYSDKCFVFGSLSVVEVKSTKTGQSTCTTTALHLVHWLVVSLIPAVLLQR